MLNGKDDDLDHFVVSVLELDTSDIDVSTNENRTNQTKKFIMEMSPIQIDYYRNENENKTNCLGRIDAIFFLSYSICTCQGQTKIVSISTSHKR